MYRYPVFQYFLSALDLSKPCLLTILVLLSGCISVPHTKGPGWYVVKPTDTLYSISWRYGLDYHDIARWNGLNEDYLIHPGQQLVLLEPEHLPESNSAGDKVDTVESPEQQTVKVTPLPDPDTINSQPTNNISVDPNWSWPTDGPVTSLFSFKDLDRRGIDIAGKIGQPVHAVAAGKVVYSGTGLAGYGNLIIIKHNDTFLSAYAYNRNRLVAEGTLVKQGGLIAEMGQDKDRNPILHFQIRKNGKPVDPLSYLPRK